MAAMSLTGAAASLGAATRQNLAAAPVALKKAAATSTRTAFVGQPLTTEAPSRKATRSSSSSSRRSAGVRAQGASFEGKPTVLVAEKLGEGGVDLLKQYANVDCSYNLTPEELCAKISLVDALIVRSGTKVTREVFEASQGRLKVVGRAGVGIDNVDLQAATEAGCLVVNAPTANTVAAAEHGIALLTALARNVAQADASMKKGEWKRSKYVGASLVDKTLAVMGFGKVGSEVARRAKGLGMTVIAHDPYASADRAAAIGVELVSFEEALSRADFLSLHMPLTPTTNKIFNDETFAKCKKGVRLVNVARGGVIDEEALVRALESGQVAQAALDVFTEEPPAANHPLVMHPQVIATPHLGASTTEAQEGVALEIAEAVVGALKGELAATAVNAPMVPAEVLEELSPYVELGEKLGRLAIQLVAEGGIKDVKLTYKTARSGDDLDTRLLRAMVLKGLIEPVSNSVLNLVNADYIAKQRGIRVSEEKQPSEGGDESLPLESIQIQLFQVDSKMNSATGAQKEIVLAGEVKDGIPHLTSVGNFETDISMEGSVLLCKNNDQPGIIGRVGTLLASHDINISFMSVGRTGPRQSAVMALGLDDHLPADVMHGLKEIPMIEELVFLDLAPTAAV